MKVMGVRVSTESVRYAVIDYLSDGTFLFCNTEDNRLLFPRDAETDIDKMMWFWDSFERLMGVFQDISKIVIKLPEFGRNETSASRLIHYLNAIIMMVASRHMHPVAVEGKNYRTLGTRSADVKTYVISHGIARTQHYWDTKICDAIAAAISERN